MLPAATSTTQRPSLTTLRTITRTQHTRRSRSLRWHELLALRGHDELKHIGRLRLGRILLYQDKAQEVVDLLAANEIGSFAALTDELIGDAQTALGNVEAAGEAYRKALADPSPEPTLNRGLVQMKLADLPDPAAIAEATMLEAAEAPESEVSAEEPADEAMSMEVDAELSTDEEAEETQ